MQPKEPQRSLFETLIVGLLVAGLVLATLLMLLIAWHLHGQWQTSQELGRRIVAVQEDRLALEELIARHEAGVQQLDSDVGTEERRRAQLAEEERQAAVLRAQEEAKRRADEEAQRRNSPAELMKRAEALLRERRYPDALKLYSALLQQEPGNARALVNRALIQLELRRTDEALADLDRAALADPRDGYVFQTRAAVLLELHRTERAADALADCERGLQLGEAAGGNVAYLRYHRGTALLALGRVDEARADFQWVHDHAPAMRRIVDQVLRAIDAKQTPAPPSAPEPGGE